MSITITILEDRKEHLKFKVVGEDHTLCNALADELHNDDKVKVASYRIEHPLVREPIFLIETSGKEAKESLKEACTRLKKKTAEFRKLCDKELS